MLRKDWDDLADGQKGDWYFHTSRNDLYITIRYGNDKFDVVSIPITTAPKQDNSWLWDGNKESPTITPSIRILGGNGQPDKWHGWLTAGKIVEA